MRTRNAPPFLAAVVRTGIVLLTAVGIAVAGSDGVETGGDPAGGLQESAAARAACPSADPKALNLAWTATDANGFPRNPWWVTQDAAPRKTVDPADACTCGGFPTKAGVPNGDPQCTEQGVPDVPRGFHSFTCKLEWFIDGRTGVTRGHINWFPVVVTGRAWFDHHSGADDDVNFELAPDTTAPDGGIPGQTKWNVKAGELERPDSLHVEMKKAETLAFVSETWWSDLASAGKAAARAKVQGARAVVVGLFGLDAEHKGHSELHPAYALAFQTQCAEDRGRVAETWAVFLRNYGNAGWCSRWKDWHRLPLDNDGLVLQLPLASTPRSFSPGTTALFSNTGVAATVGVSSSGPIADVAVAWAPLPESKELRVHGQVSFSWVPAAAGGNCPAAPAAALVRANAGQTDETEEWIEDILRRAPPSATAEFRAVPSRDDTPVKSALPAPASFTRSGPCPRNEATCADALRARVGDAFFGGGPAALAAEARRVEEQDVALCDAARASLRDYAEAAKGKLIDAPESMRLRRTEALVSMCEVQAPTGSTP